MKDIKLAIGRKVFGFRCDEKDAEKLLSLSAELNKIVNTNTVKYRGLSEDNVFLLTTFELLDTIKKGGHTESKSSSNDVRTETKTEVIVKEVSKLPNPPIYHPYPRSYYKPNSKPQSLDLFEQEVYQDARMIDILTDKQQQIENTVNSITDSLHNMIISLANLEK